MKSIRSYIIMLFIAAAITGCEYGEEIPPPDICGIYTGTRKYKTLSNEIMTIDIQTVNKDGLSGTITYSNTTQQYSCSFKGQWQESGSDIDIYFDEIRIIERINFSGYVLYYSYRAEVNDSVMSGTMSPYGYSSTIPFSAKRSDPAAEIPEVDPDNPVLPDN